MKNIRKIQIRIVLLGCQIVHSLTKIIVFAVTPPEDTHFISLGITSEKIIEFEKINCK